MCKNIVLKIVKQINTIINIEEDYRIPVKLNSETKIIARLTEMDMEITFITNCKRNKSFNNSGVHNGQKKKTCLHQ